MHEHEPIRQSLESSKGLEKFQLREGLNAIVVPDLGDRSELHEPLVPHLEDAISRLQIFLDEIDGQDGEVLAVLPLMAFQRTIGNLPIWNEPEHVQWIQEQKLVFIIRKKPNGLLNNES